jgi:hypothetical protein
MFLDLGPGYNVILLQLLAMAVPTSETGRLLHFEVPWLFKKVSDLDVLKRLFVPLIETQFFKQSKKASDQAAVNKLNKAKAKVRLYSGRPVSVVETR